MDIKDIQMDFDEEFGVNDFGAVSFQGLEMREMNDQVLQRSTNRHELSEFELYSEAGIPFRVYAKQGKGTPILTFHDIGTNHNSFIPFFNTPEMRVMLQQFTVYHICAPGHHDTAGPLAAEAFIKDEGDSLLGNAEIDGNGDEPVYTIFGKPSQTTPLTFPSMDELACIVDVVVKHFKLKCFIGFGIGAGSNVLTRYALNFPDQVLGLFLMNPTITTAGYYIWLKQKWSSMPQLRKGIITDALKRQMEAHWFGTPYEVNQVIADLYFHQMSCMNFGNVAGFIESYQNRTDLGLIRPPVDINGSAQSAVNASQLSRMLRVDACLVTGDLANEHCKAMADMNGRMDPSKTQFMVIPGSSGMLVEEIPENVAYNFLNFVRTIGLAINLTPEKLKSQAIELQSQTSPRRPTNDPVPFASSFS